MSILQDRIALVTGASRGIGKSIALALASAGAHVAVNYQSRGEAAAEVCQQIEALGRKAIAVQADVSKKADVERLFAETKKAYGKLNVLVNNAGVYEFAPLEGVTEEVFHKQFNLNVLGLLLATQEAVKLIGPDGGSIINISSGVSTIYPPNSSTYTATKAAVDAITVVLSKELGPRKIRVNALNPGLIETEGVRTGGYNEGEFRKWVESTSALGRIGQPDDIAPTAVYLASSDSKYLTGETVRVTGGM